MGTEYFLVNRERRVVLDLHKAYWLDYDDRERVTEVDVVESAREGGIEGDHPWAWLPPLIVRWLRDVSGGPAELLDDLSDSWPPWGHPGNGRPEDWTLHTPWTWSPEDHPHGTVVREDDGERWVRWFPPDLYAACFPNKTAEG